MIRIQGLTKRYSSIKALKGIDFSIAAGELFAYLGPNGAGKTTTIRILAGLTRPGGGRCTVNGCDVVRQSLDARRAVGLVPQAINLDRELAVAENLEVHGRLFAMTAPARRRRIAELLDYVGLAERPYALVKTLSGGLQRRLMIARALLHEPPVLLLDEPTVGLDPEIRRRIWALVKKIQAGGTTVLLTTHYIEEAEFLADRVAFVDEGSIVALDTPRALMATQGAWAIDRFDGGGLETSCFADREAAQAFGAAQADSFTVRRVNLEDAFLALTGKKVAPQRGEH